MAGRPGVAPHVTVAEDRCLRETSRPPGQNTIGMIAWRVTLYTPQYPQSVGGREIIVIANDITHQVRDLM